MCDGGVPFELHVYPCGEHGLSSCDLEVNFQGADTYRNRKWLDDCSAFFHLYAEENFCNK